MEIVSFKSIPENYEKEFSGRKRNTLREMDIYDRRYELLKKWTPETTMLVEIVNTDNGHKFRREITDVTFWKGWTLISW